MSDRDCLGSFIVPLEIKNLTERYKELNILHNDHIPGLTLLTAEEVGAKTKNQIPVMVYILNFSPPYLCSKIVLPNINSEDTKICYHFKLKDNE